MCKKKKAREKGKIILSHCWVHFVIQGTILVCLSAGADATSCRFPLTVCAVSLSHTLIYQVLTASPFRACWLSPLPHLNPQLSKFTSRQQKVQSCKAAFHCRIKVRISWVHCNKIYIWNMGLSYLPCPKPFCKAWAGLLCLCRVSTSRGSLREFQGILCKVKLLHLSAFYQEKSGQWHYTITPLCNIFFS